MEIPGYCNDGVRRHDRLLDGCRAAGLLRDGEYAFLSMVEERDGQPAGYGLPVSYVWDGGRHIYIHCAPCGHKLDCTDRVGRVSLCVVGRTNVLPARFTTEYESVIVRGVMRRGLDESERMHALELIVGKYSSEHKAVGMKYAAGSFHRTEVVRLDIESASGKQKTVRQ